jgi:hypothetical protein
MGRYGKDRYGVDEYGRTSESSDVLGPLLIPISPTNGQAGVAIDSTISFRITDATAVNLDTVSVEVDTGGGFAQAFKYDEIPQFKSGYDGPASAVSGDANNFQVVVDPTTDFGGYQLVQVRVNAYDTVGNPIRL